MSLEELLLQLNDITAPPQPGWWPLALGWWYLIGGFLFFWVSLWFYKKKQVSTRSYRLANRELQGLKQRYASHKDNSQLALDLSEWLKRVALFTFPEKNPAGLTGQHWLEFLDQSAGHDQFTNGVGHIFGRTVYARQFDVDADKLLVLCDGWLEKIKPQMAQQELI